MSALKQLEAINATAGSWSDETEAKAAGWVDKYGEAVAELINAADLSRKFHQINGGDGSAESYERLTNAVSVLADQPAKVSL